MNFFSIKYAEIHGIQYRPGCVLRFADMDELGERDYPSYGKLQDIFIWEDEKFFVLIVLKTVEFNSHLMSYKVLPTDQRIVIRPQSLTWHGLLNMVVKNGSFFVVEKESAAIEDSEL